MPNSNRRVDYIFYRETSKDLFFRNLTSKPLGGIEIVDQQRISFDKDPVVNFFIFVPNGEDNRSFYRHWGKELFRSLEGEVNISAGYIRQGVFESILGMSHFSSEDPAILILQTKEQDTKRAEGLLKKLNGKEYIEEGEHETLIFRSKEVDKSTFDQELIKNSCKDISFEAFEKIKAELVGNIRYYNEHLLEKVINLKNEQTDKSDLNDGRFKPRKIRINSELAKQLIEGLKESVEGCAANSPERK